MSKLTLLYLLKQTLCGPGLVPDLGWDEVLMCVVIKSPRDELMEVNFHQSESVFIEFVSVSEDLSLLFVELYNAPLIWLDWIETRVCLGILM